MDCIIFLYLGMAVLEAVTASLRRYKVSMGKPMIYDKSHITPWQKSWCIDFADVNLATDVYSCFQSQQI